MGEGKGPLCSRWGVAVGNTLAEGGSERVRHTVELQQGEPFWGGAHGKIPP